VTVSTSRLAFNDCFDVFDQALGDPTGIRIAFSTEGLARHFRTRLHQARAIDRADNAKLHPFDHPMHGRSAYDSIIAKLRNVDGQWYVYLVPLRDAGNMRIESLEGLEIPPPPPAPPRIYKPEDQFLEMPEPMKQITFRRR
jgi:hypothetical protein